MSKLTSPFTVNGVIYDHVRKWSSEADRHARKFIVNPVDYFDGRVSRRDESMRLWVEAEWDSLCRRIGKNFTNVMPCYEHIVRNIPQQYRTVSGDCINTDPYVFGEAFKYCCCQQYRQRGPTRLHNLPPDSIILFGSNKNGGFCLDTVFVVDRSPEMYSKGEEICGRLAEMDEDFRKKISPEYQRRVLGKIGHKEQNEESDGCLPTEASQAVSKAQGCLPEEDGGNQLSLYVGKVFDSTAPQKPFSFVPVIPGSKSYPRPLLTPFAINGKNVISPNMQQGFKVTEIPRKLIADAWSKLLKAIPPQYKYAWHIDE